MNPTKFRIYIRGLKKQQELVFNDSFHEGWNLFLEKNPNDSFCLKHKVFEDKMTTECAIKEFSISVNDLFYLVKKPIFEETHTLENDFANKWIVDKDYVVGNFDKSYYKVNEDGSIDVEFLMYFRPQSFFYLGTIISLSVFAIVIVLHLKYKKINI
jgi:hypothetical protein